MIFKCVCLLHFRNRFLVGTHDIQNISVSSPLPGQVRVTGYFIEGSTAIGVLVAILTATENLYLYLITRDGDLLQFESTVAGVIGGVHYASVFVMDENGLPFNKTASIPQVVSVKNSKQYFN